MNLLQDFDYFLPSNQIAQYPLSERSSARLMVLHRNSNSLQNRRFLDILEYLRPGDVLVLNDTKVTPARLVGRRAKTGGRIECLLVERIESARYLVLVQPSRGIRIGTQISFLPSVLTAEVVGETENCKIIQFNSVNDPETELKRIGQVPLPPYIKRSPEVMDQKRYQTIYAKKEGAIAAPTAGLHFTDQLLQAIMSQGVGIVYVTLHVGPGTFIPVRDEEVSKHRMWEEQFCLTFSSAEQLNRVRDRKGRIIAIGTTTCRVLETTVDTDGKFHAKEGKTDLFITPGYQFRGMGGLVTNFHLPKTTLLMLVSAFAGREWILQAYQEAIREGYRFYSYGDAMLII